MHLAQRYVVFSSSHVLAVACNSLSRLGAVGMGRSLMKHNMNTHCPCMEIIYRERDIEIYI